MSAEITPVLSALAPGFQQFLLVVAALLVAAIVLGIVGWRARPAVARRARAAEPLHPAERPLGDHPLPDLHHRRELAAAGGQDRGAPAHAVPDARHVERLLAGVDAGARLLVPLQQLRRDVLHRRRAAPHVDLRGVRVRVPRLPVQAHDLRRLPRHDDGAVRGRVLHEPPDGREPGPAARSSATSSASTPTARS